MGRRLVPQCGHGLGLRQDLVWTALAVSAAPWESYPSLVRVVTPSSIPLGKSGEVGMTPDLGIAQQVPRVGESRKTESSVHHVTPREQAASDLAELHERMVSECSSFGGARCELSEGTKLRLRENKKKREKVRDAEQQAEEEQLLAKLQQQQEVEDQRREAGLKKIEDGLRASFGVRHEEASILENGELSDELLEDQGALEFEEADIDDGVGLDSE